jgi:hypothetical protein
MQIPVSFKLTLFGRLFHKKCEPESVSLPECDVVDVLAGRVVHHTGNFAEDPADAAGHTRHDCTSRYRNEACHQSVLNQILPPIVSPDVQAAN